MVLVLGLGSYGRLAFPVFLSLIAVDNHVRVRIMSDIPDCGLESLELDGSIYCGLGFGCNNDCVLCVANISEKHENMSTSQMVAYFDRLIDNKNLTIQISGGEPTIRGDFLYLMEYLSVNAPRITKVLLSNGRMFSNTDFTARVSDYPPVCVLVPLHSYEPKLHDMITRRPGSFDETVLGIRNLLEYKIIVIPKIIVNKLNYKLVPDFVEFIAQTFPECKAVGVDTIDLLGSAGANKEMLKVKHTESAPYIQKAIDVAQKYGLHMSVIYMPFCLVEERYRKFISADQFIVMYKDPRDERTKGSLTKERGTVEACGKCKYVGECPGTWYSYFREFGYDELKPIYD